MNTPADELADVLAAHPDVQLGFLFGSVAQGTPRPDSDLDVAVMGTVPLEAGPKKKLMETLAQRIGRPVDLVDLQTARGVIVRKVLQTGTRIYDDDPDHRLFAALLTRHAFYQADFAPYRRRLLAERRRAWIER